jgi:hypothetical protein
MWAPELAEPFDVTRHFFRRLGCEAAYQVMYATRLQAP